MTGRPVNPLFTKGLRKCNLCGEVKALDEFHVAGNSTGRQFSCKVCACARAAANYRENRVHRRIGVKAPQSALLAETRRLKDVPCADCGGRFPAVCMDFDHLDNKVLGVSQMVHRGYALEAILAEIAKCEVVCANCHRVRTATRGENTARALRTAV